GSAKQLVTIQVRMVAAGVVDDAARAVNVGNTTQAEEQRVGDGAAAHEIKGAKFRRPWCVGGSEIKVDVAREAQQLVEVVWGACETPELMQGCLKCLARSECAGSHRAIWPAPFVPPISGTR